MSTQAPFHSPPESRVSCREYLRVCGRFLILMVTILALPVAAQTTDFGDWNGGGAATTTTNSTVNANLRLGATVDSEASVTPDAAATADGADEDGVTMPGSINAGATMAIPVTLFNNTGSPAYLDAWIDFNNDGTFSNVVATTAGSGERSRTQITVASSASTQSAMVVFDIPSAASAGTLRGVRFRLSNSNAHTPTSSGATGEIEDYVVTIDSSSACNLFVSDFLNGAVYRFSPTTGTYQGVFVPAGNNGMTVGMGMVRAPDGNLLVASRTDNTVKKYNAGTGAFMSNFVTAGSGSLSSPSGLAIGPDGNLYVGGHLNKAVKKYNGTTGAYIGDFITPAAGVPDGPYLGMVFASGVFYLMDLNFGNVGATGSRILKYDAVTGAAQGTLASFGTSTARDLVLGSDGFLYATEGGNATIWKVDRSTGAKTSFAVMSGAGPYPMGLAWEPSGNLVVTDNWNNVKQRYNTSGTALGSWGTNPTLTNGSFKDVYYLCPCPTVTVPASLANGTVSLAYSQTVTASGGAGYYTFTIASGSLPTGLSLNSSTGVISGTPSVTGSFTFSIRAADYNGCGVTQSYTVTIGGALSIGNLVFVDTNANGLKDLTEPGIPGLTVQLWTPGVNGTEENGGGDDVQVGTSITTDINGNYAFSSLSAGTYYVRIPTPPAAYPQVTTTVALDNGVDNDSNGQQSASGAAVRSPKIALAIGAEPAVGVDGDGTNGDLTVDFGFLYSDACYLSNLFDNPSFELTGNPNTNGAAFAALGYNGTGSNFGANVNSLRWVAGTNGVSPLSTPIYRQQVLAIGATAKVAWVESAKARNGKRYMLFEGTNSCLDLRAVAAIAARRRC